jgi:hypothetical protein
MSASEAKALTSNTLSDTLKDEQEKKSQINDEVTEN